MSDTVNMSLDDIIKQNRASRSRERRGNGRGRGRGGGRGNGRGRGRGRGGGGGSRSGTPNGGRARSRSRSRGPRGGSQGRSQSRARSRSRQARRSVSRGRSALRSRSNSRGLTPKGRAGLEENQSEMPQLVHNNRFNRGGRQNQGRPWRGNSNVNNIHSRIGITTRRGSYNLRKPLATTKRGIAKRGRGISMGNRYSSVGLRSDQILKEQRQHILNRSSTIKSQTFTRSRNNSFSSASQLTVSVANNFAKRRRNSVGNTGYLNKQSLSLLNDNFGNYNNRKGPGSVKSVGSNRSYQSNRSNRSRGRGRARGGNRGVGRKFLNKQILNPKLQKEIADIQGKTYGSNSVGDTPNGVNFTPTPAATGKSLHERFATT